jgi:hypothetical protein
MVSDLLGHELILLALLWLVVLSYWAWPRSHANTDSANQSRSNGPRDVPKIRTRLPA